MNTLPTLNNIQGVDISNPSIGDVIQWDGTKWINEPPVSSLDGLSDVGITTPGDGEVLTYNGSGWVNDTLPPSDVIITTTGSITTRDAAWEFPENTGIPANSTGTHNISVGPGALHSTTSGYENIAVGSSPLTSNTLGIRNVGIGMESLFGNTTGQYNIGVGYQTLYNNTTGDNNIALGNTTMYDNTSGTYNIALGAAALQDNTTGTNNIAIGHGAGSQLTTGSNNTLIGGYIGVVGMGGNVVLSTGDGIVRLHHDGTKWTSGTPISMTGLILPSTTSTITLNASVGTAGQVLTSAGPGATPTWSTPTAGSFTQVIPIACSDEVTSLTTGLAKVTFRMPFAFTLSSVRASLTTAQSTGSIFTVNVRHNGTTVFSTKPTIDNTEKTTVTAVTASVLSTTSLADDAEIIVDIDQLGDGTAKGLKVYLIGTKT